MGDIGQDQAIDIMLEELMASLEDAGINVPSNEARNVLEEKFEAALEEKDDSYDPSTEDNQSVIDRAVEILIEQTGRDAWHQALQESREITYGTNVGWLYENMSGDITSDAFEELKDRYGDD